MRGAACCLVLIACSFRASHEGPIDVGHDAEPGDAPPGAPWWDPSYEHRRRLVVTTGAVRPDQGYAGYTVHLEFDPSTLSGLDPSCADLRVVTLDGETWTEHARHLTGCGTGAADLWFAVPHDLADSTAWHGAYLYYDHASPPKPLPASGAAVYLWWDDASEDRLADYVHGRMDAWNGAGHLDSMRWLASGAYTFDTGDDGQESYRRMVDERDVYVEAEWFHTGCYSNNMQTAVCARGVIASGAGATEQADHYYCTSRAQNPNCNNNDQGLYDGDVVRTDNQVIALQGLTDPPPIVPDQWRKQALAVFGANPTQVRFWDADASWPALGYPPSAALQATGVDAMDHAERGFAGVMITQDIGEMRGLVIRRYVEPEPTVAVEDEEIVR